MADLSLGRNTRVAMLELSGMPRLRSGPSTPKLRNGQDIVQGHGDVGGRQKRRLKTFDTLNL
jgi:hypothetical protein